MTLSSPDARLFLEECYAEQPQYLAERINALTNPDFRWNTTELTYAGKVAWRNSSRCIGRLFWSTLKVRDERHLHTPHEVAHSLFEHLELAYNGGKINSVMTVLPNWIRVISPQLMCYAGYETATGILGDGANIVLTREAQRLGWRGKGTSFDVLPLLLETNGERSFFSLPEQIIYEVPIRHPQQPALNTLGLKWYAVPVISDAKMVLAGQRFSVAFNGWYMGTEIAARDLADPHRYDQLPRVAKALGLDTSHPRTLWQDRALVELNWAVLESFRAAGVHIVDHHTAGEQWLRFQEREAAAGREVRGNWSWLIPPLSPATSPVWSQRLVAEEISPRFVRCPFSTSL